MCKAERDQQIADLYTSGHSASSLARNFALSIPSIRSIVKATGAKRMPKDKENAAVKTKRLRRSLGQTQERLGELVASVRMLELKQGRTEAAERLGWTTHKIAAIENGHIDATVTDLLDLMRYTGKPIQELIKA
jgi:DNA-binding XRE family transcriptional regulator